MKLSSTYIIQGFIRSSSEYQNLKLSLRLSPVGDSTSSTCIVADFDSDEVSFLDVALDLARAVPNSGRDFGRVRELHLTTFRVDPEVGGTGVEQDNEGWEMAAMSTRRG